MKFRTKLKSGDLSGIKKILESTGFFYDFEIEVALETAEENYTRGEEASGYFFILAEEDGEPVAFACYGMAPCTIDSYDLYWIAVHEQQKGKGYGKELMRLVEKDVAARKGKKIWIETSGRPLYAPTREFYLRQGCDLVAELPDFYADNDSKVVFLKKV